MSKTVIIGAGITGISCAYFSRKPYIILEKENKPGGLCRSVRADGYTFDYSGHFFHVRNKQISLLISTLLQNNLSRIKRNAFIYSNKRFIPYPFQANLLNLPEKVKNECLQGFIDRPGGTGIKPMDSFYNWSLATFGKGITKYFMKPYNEKLWTVPSKELTAEWVAPFVPQPTLEEVKRGARKKQEKKFGYNTYFYYPRTGGCQSFIDALLPKVKNLQLGESSKKINLRLRTILTSKGNEIKYDKIISTQPLYELLGQIEGLPVSIKNAAKELRWNSVSCLNLGVTKGLSDDRAINGKHWIYFPEKEYVFYRAGIYSNIIPSSAPKDSRSFYVEVSHKPERKIDKDMLLSRTIKGLSDSKLLRTKKEIEVVNWLDIPCAYVIFDKNRPKAVKIILDFLRSKNIHSIGRYGAWKYSFMEESMLDAQKLAGEL